MLIGMAFSAAFANIIDQHTLEDVMWKFNPLLGISMILVILNLGASLDYHLILGAGLYTAVYIISRACGKYFGAYFGLQRDKSAQDCEEIFGIYLAASFRSIFGVYRNCCFRSERTGTGMCTDYSGNDCGSSCYQ